MELTREELNQKIDEEIRRQIADGTLAYVRKKSREDLDEDLLDILRNMAVRKNDRIFTQKIYNLKDIKNKKDQDMQDSYHMFYRALMAMVLDDKDLSIFGAFTTDIGILMRYLREKADFYCSQDPEDLDRE